MENKEIIIIGDININILNIENIQVKNYMDSKNYMDRWYN